MNDQVLVILRPLKLEIKKMELRDSVITRSKYRQSINQSKAIKSQRSSILIIVVSSFLFLCLINNGGVHAKLTITKECGELICKAHSYCSQIDHSCRPCQIACDPSLGNYQREVCEKDCQDYLHDLWYMRKGNESDFRDELYIDLYYKVQSDLRLLKILIGVLIILSTICLLAIFGMMIYFKRMRNRLHLQQQVNNPYTKNSKKIGDYPVIYSNSKVLSLPLPDVHHKGPPSNISSSINNNLSRGSSPDLVSGAVTLTSYSNSSKKKKGKEEGLIMGNPMTMMNSTPSLKEKQSRLRKEPSESTLPEYQAYDNPAMVPSPTHM